MLSQALHPGNLTQDVANFSASTVFLVPLSLKQQFPILNNLWLKFPLVLFSWLDPCSYPLFAYLSLLNIKCS